jgi:hypothetical protein
MMTEEELRELGNDIKKNGLRDRLQSSTRTQGKPT